MMKLGKRNSDENKNMRWYWKNGDEIESKETKLKTYVYYLISRERWNQKINIFPFLGHEPQLLCFPSLRHEIEIRNQPLFFDYEINTICWWNQQTKLKLKAKIWWN